MRWIKCDKQMPEPGKTYIACTNTDSVLALNYRANRYAKTPKGQAPRWEWMFGRVYPGIITHWMPLPPPPSDRG